MFKLLTTVFDEPAEPLHDDYVEQLLNQDSFWALAAFADGELVGGLTAQSLPMTRSHASELLIYDIGAAQPPTSRSRTSPDGRTRRLAHAARITEIFVSVDDQDTHAFYRAGGGTPTAVMFYGFAVEP